MDVQDNGIVSRRTLFILIGVNVVVLVIRALLPPPTPPWAWQLRNAAVAILVVVAILQRLPRDKNVWTRALRIARERWRRGLAGLVIIVGMPVVIRQLETKGISGLPWWAQSLLAIVVLAAIGLMIAARRTDETQQKFRGTQ